MVELSKETVEKFKKLFREKDGAEYTDTEAWVASHNLVGFFDLLLKIDERNKREGRDEKVVSSGME